MNQDFDPQVVRLSTSEHQIPMRGKGVVVATRTPSQIGSAIQRRRKMLKLSQKDLASRTNLRPATVSAVENGEPGTKLDTLLTVLSALGLELVLNDLDAFLGGNASS